MAETDAGARPPGDESEKGSFKKKDLVAMGGVAAFPDQSKQFTKDLRSRLSARTGNSIPLPDSSDDEDAALAAPADAAAAPVEGVAAASVQFAEPAAAVDASADAASLPAQQQSQDLPGPSAAPGTLEFNNQLSMRLKELEGRARVESRGRADSSFILVDSKRESIDARVEKKAALDSLSFQSSGGREEMPPAPAPAPAPEPAAPAPPPRQLGPRMSMREAKAETTKVQAAIANLANRVEGLRSDNTRLRKRAGLALSGAPAAAAPGPSEEKAAGMRRGASKDAMQLQVLELQDRQAGLEREEKALQEENHHLKKRVEEQEDEASLLAEVQKGAASGDSFTQGAAQIAASGKALAYGGAAQKAAREVKISTVPAAPPPAPVGKRGSDAGKRGSGSGPPAGARREAPAPEVEMTSRLSGSDAPPGFSHGAAAQAPAALPGPSRLSGGRGSTGDRGSGPATGGRGSGSGERRGSAREDAQPLRGNPPPDPPQSCCKKCCVIS